MNFALPSVAFLFRPLFHERVRSAVENKPGRSLPPDTASAGSRNGAYRPGAGRARFEAALRNTTATDFGLRRPASGDNAANL